MSCQWFFLTCFLGPPVVFKPLSFFIFYHLVIDLIVFLFSGGSLSRISTVTWSLEPHTLAKHMILENYLKAWFPILGLGTDCQLFYFDGFAGPGEYSEGERGSPIIALESARKVATLLNHTATFVFSELDSRRSDHLEGLLRGRVWPSNFVVEVKSGIPFDQVMGRYLSDIESGSLSNLAMFSFVDPFGWTGFPMQLIKRILRIPMSEVLINFMYEEVNRFISRPDQARNFDCLFGSSIWDEVDLDAPPAIRNRRLHDLYQGQLSDFAGARYVRSFEMRNKNNNPDYYLFHVTNHLKGLEKMKEAMWKVDPSGQFRFSDATDPNQLVLFGSDPDLGYLRSSLAGKYSGCSVRYEDLRVFVLEGTAFLETHLKGCLRAMEYDPSNPVRVRPFPGRNKGTFAKPNLVLDFAPSPAGFTPTMALF